MRGTTHELWLSGAGSVQSLLAGTVRDGTIVAARVLCTQYEVQDREEGTWQIAARVDSSSSACLSHESPDVGSCDQTLRCPEGQFMTSPSEIGDPTIQGIVAGCTEIDALQVRGEDGEIVEQPVEIDVSNTT